MTKEKYGVKLRFLYRDEIANGLSYKRRKIDFYQAIYIAGCKIC